MSESDASECGTDVTDRAIDAGDPTRLISVYVLDRSRIDYTTSESTHSHMAEAYRGVIGAIPYAFKRSDSRLLQLYAVLGTLTAVLIGLLVVFGVIVLMGATADSPGGAFTFSRSLFVIVGAATIAPLLAPTLFVARRHRLDLDVSGWYDSALALSGFLFTGLLYVGLVVTVPPDQQVIVTGVAAPFVEFLYALPQLSGLVPPLVGAVGIYGVHRRLRHRE